MLQSQAQRWSERKASLVQSYLPLVVPSLSPHQQLVIFDGEAGAVQYGNGRLATAGAAIHYQQLASKLNAAVQIIVRTTSPDLAFGNVACPEAVSKQVGTKFSCTVQLPGAFLVVDGTVSSANGTVTFLAAQAVLPKAQLEQFVAANASLPATVSCGAAPFLVARPNQVVTCRAALADGTARTVELTVADTAGNVTITGVA